MKRIRVAITQSAELEVPDDFVEDHGNPDDSNCDTAMYGEQLCDHLAGLAGLQSTLIRDTLQRSYTVAWVMAETVTCWKCGNDITSSEAQLVAEELKDLANMDDLDDEGLTALLDGDDRAGPESRLPNGDTVVCMTCVAMAPRRTAAVATGYDPNHRCGDTPCRHYELPGDDR